MDFLDEDSFIAQFQERLKATRDQDMKFTHSQMAHALGIEKDAYKKYENRPRSAFPLYLLPRLIFVSGKPYSYWLGGRPEARARMRVVK